jgi:hypothetical protein
MSVLGLGVSRKLLAANGKRQFALLIIAALNYGERETVA